MNDVEKIFFEDYSRSSFCEVMADNFDFVDGLNDEIENSDDDYASEVEEF